MSNAQLVISGLLAIVGTAVGVLAGHILAMRSTIRQERRDAYSSFLGLIASMPNSFVQQAHHAKLRDANRVASLLASSLLTELGQLDVIGSQAVVRAADELKDGVLEVLRTEPRDARAPAFQTGGYGESWGVVTRPLLYALVNAMRKDLRLPSLDRSTFRVDASILT